MRKFLFNHWEFTRIAFLYIIAALGILTNYVWPLPDIVARIYYLTLGVGISYLSYLVIGQNYNDGVLLFIKKLLLNYGDNISFVSDLNFEKYDGKIIKSNQVKNLELEEKELTKSCILFDSKVIQLNKKYYCYMPIENIVSIN